MTGDSAVHDRGHIGFEIRDARPADAAACAAIYAPYVRDTAISFELEPPTAQLMAQRIAAAQRAHAWLVLVSGGDGGVGVVSDGVVGGYAYAGVYKERAAYRWSCEVSVYVDPARHRTGAGRALYEALFERLAQRGYRTAVAGMTLPNPASEALHRALGFELVGVYRGIGYKHGQWLDVAWLQRPLVEPRDPPAELR